MVWLTNRKFTLALQVAFGLQAEQQLVYLRKAEGRAFPAGIARHIKVLPGLSN
jgi:hypothetical protein